ncbi:hypothetical protein SDC9_42789 [bioreactor metagenome]|uniref:Uncharacterized protein n=1 Tax=bioreactor metagenome TaxID=1076179 RepID=A0A644VZ72_9ZZZZ
MFIELKCKNCNKRFDINFDNKEVEVNKCPKCGALLSSYESERLWHLAETYYSDTKSLNSVSVAGIHEAQKSIVISSDIDSLNELYNISNPDVRQRMTSLFDLFYLLMFHDSKDKKIKELDNTIKEVRTLWEKRINAKEKIAKELLCIDGEDEKNG